MSSYTPEHYYGHIPGTYPMQYGLLPWPEHLKPQSEEAFREGRGGRKSDQVDNLSTRSTASFGIDVIVLTLSAHDRVGIATTIERLIGLLDEMDGDENLEPYLAGYHDLDGDREADGDDIEPDNDAEYSLGWQDDGNQAHLQCAGFGDGDLEADLGTTEDIDQVRRLEIAGGVMAGLDEPCLGWAESHGRGIVGQQNCLDDREHEDEREPNGDEADYVSSEDDAPTAALVALTPLPREQAARLPDDTIMRRFQPSDVETMIPQISPENWRAMHYRAANERLQ